MLGWRGGLGVGPATGALIDCSSALLRRLARALLRLLRCSCGRSLRLAAAAGFLLWRLRRRARLAKRGAMASSAVAQRVAGVALASRSAWQENGAAGARLLAALCNSLIETRSVAWRRASARGRVERGLVDALGDMVLLTHKDETS